MIIELPIVGGSFENDSKILSTQEAINVYPEQSTTGVGLVGLHGTLDQVTPGGPIRALHAAFGTLYCVAGPELYEISSAGVATALGSVAGTGTCCITHNIFELLILSGGKAFTVQKDTNVIAAVPDIPVSSVCDYLDGYGIVLETGSGRFHYTTINDFDTISGIDFATAEGAPDNLVSLIVDHRELILLGETSGEIWTNTGDATNPIQRAPGGFFERGCKSAHSSAKLDNSVIWLGDDLVVYRLDGARPVRLSNHGIEDQIAKTTVDPIAMAYNWHGHAFYQLTFPGELTVCFDAATKTWHTRKTDLRLDYAPQHHAYAYGKHWVGGANNILYQLSTDSYEHTGELYRSRAIGPFRTPQYATMNELTFAFAAGEQVNPSDESEVFLEISDDGGRTFPDRLTTSIGAAGQYRYAARFHCLGGFWDAQRVVRIAMTDQARFSLIGAFADIT